MVEGGWSGGKVVWRKEGLKGKQGRGRVSLKEVKVKTVYGEEGLRGGG